AASAQRVLVFFRPADRADSTLLHAWQTLGPPPNGGRQAFTLDGRLAVVASEDRAQGSSSARWSIGPGQTLVARRRNGQGPQLEPGPEQSGQAGAPARVLNADGGPLRITWYCDERPFLRQTVEPGSAAELRLPLGDLLFQILEPSRNGLYRPADVLRSPIDYPVPEHIRRVEILWSLQDLVFDPPGAGPAPTAGGEEPQPEPETGPLPKPRPTARKRKS
ncbi:MAG: hypothetical protein ABUT39_25240, partial [Acidobacteriota bacterium]